MTPRALALASLVALSGCTGLAADPSEQDGQNDAITAGQLVAGNAPYYWANLTFEQHLAALAAVGALSNANDVYAAEDDVLRRRLQRWADHFDAVMRTVTKNDVAPHPLVQVLESNSTSNAWSQGTFVRLGAPLGDLSSPLAQGTSFYLSGDAHGTRIEPVGLALDALPHPAEWKRVATFVDIWNRNPRVDQNCELKVAGGRVTRKDAGCAVLGQGSNDALVMATSPFITFSTDLAAAFTDERTIALVMAHELGHLWRAHSSPLTVRKYDFWFEQGPTKGKRPVEAADAESLKAGYLSFVRSPLGTDRVEGAVLPATIRILPLAAAYYTERVQLDAPTVATPGISTCDGYAAWVAANGQPSALISAAVYSDTLTPAQSAAYVALEDLVLGCTAPVTFSATLDPVTLDGSWLSQLLAGTGKQFAMPPSPAVGETLAAYVKRARTFAEGVQRNEADFLTRMRKNHLGMYTTEQEADEVAMELMVRGGFTREDALAGWVAFAKAFDGPPRAIDPKDTGNASITECEQWMKDGFMTKDASGNATPVVMTLGDLSDNHHGTCYRLYNLWRESKSHRYDAVMKAPTLDSPWSDVRAHAQQLTDSVRLTCGGLAACTNACSTAACQTACVARATDEGKAQYDALATCLGQACPNTPTTAGQPTVPCSYDPQTLSYLDGAACQACFNAAQAVGGACNAAVVACK